MVVGFEIAGARLRKKNIFTLFLDKINQAGRVKLCCFDKTGTLIENTLQLRGIQPITKGQTGNKNLTLIEEAEPIGNQQGVIFDDFYDNIASYQLARPLSPSNVNYLMYEAFSCCHSLQKLEIDIVGDPIEVQMFKETGFSIEHKLTSRNHALTIITPSEEYISKLNLDPSTKLTIDKIYDFMSDRKRMSVIVSGGDSKRMYLKGAPETVKTLCQEQSLPVNYDQVLRDCTEQGYRVLSLAYKNIDPEAELRSSIEDGLTFMGFIIFDNPLKPQSKGTLEILRNCGIRSAIITGNNLLTALSVGISLELFNYRSRVFIGQAKEGKVVWEEIENEHNRELRGVSLHRGKSLVRRQSTILSHHSLHDSFINLHGDQDGLMSIILKEAKANNCVICMTG